MNTQQPRAEAVVAGHICLDIIPPFPGDVSHPEALLAPGTLVTVGPAILSTGGPVSNTGLSLHRLGVPTRLVGKVGHDLFGRAILDLLDREGPHLAGGMIVDADESTSYTVVISPPGIDRVFLHSPGANNTFRADDVEMSAVRGARLFHFGYPPLMRQMYQREGRELASLMRRVKEMGLTTSLDMAYPDPNTEAGQLNWLPVLEHTLPHVDVFVPSLDEALFMLDRARFEDLNRQEGGLVAHIDGGLLSDLSDRLLELGVALVALKLGDQGLYLRTTAAASRLEAMGGCQPQPLDDWLGRELLAPCFRVDVVGTTGAGDATIAGLLTGLLRGLGCAG